MRPTALTIAGVTEVSWLLLRADRAGAPTRMRADIYSAWAWILSLGSECHEYSARQGTCHSIFTSARLHPRLMEPGPGYRTTVGATGPETMMSLRRSTTRWHATLN